MNAARGALVGVIVAGIAGLAWTEWGATGLSGPAASPVRIAGVVIGLAIVFGAVALWPAAGHGDADRGVPAGGSMFVSRTFWLITVGEVVALFGGGAALNATGHPGYVIAWFAAVVGAHFLAFGRYFWAGFRWLGVAMIAAAIIGAVVGAITTDVDATALVAGFGSAASLFAAGGSTLGRAVYARAVS